ncbi:hypothetical protein, partial [Sphingobacterium multivorum]|uniref:hypothetical protein n=1 Tax=Sphingobacterium multivorum TaxID=28454 RepID=UPI003DA5AB05
MKIAAPCIATDIVCNEEITGKTQVFDNLKLALNAFGCDPIIAAIAPGKAICLFRRCWGRDFGVIGPIISLVIGALSDYNNIQFD